MEQPAEARTPRLRFSSGSFLIGFGIGSFIGVAFALVAIALVKDIEPAASADVLVVPTIDTTGRVHMPTPVSTPRPRSTTQLDVRLGPGPAFAVVGVMARGDSIEPVGRDATGAWVAVRFPPGSTARGWVPVAELEGFTGIDSLAVVLPTPLPRTVSTPPSFPRFDVSGNDGGVLIDQTPLPVGATATPTPIPNRLLATDLVVNRVTRLDDGRVRVVVGNLGPGVLEDEIVIVVVRDFGSNSEQLFITKELAVGATLMLETRSLRFEQETDVQVTIDPGASSRDRNRANNAMTVTLSPPPGPTPTPRSSGSND